MNKALQSVGYRVVRKLFERLPDNNLFYYHLCKGYADRFNGENNADFRTNGEYDLLQQWIDQSKLVFDVGANIGDWTAAALALKPTLEVHCFEPSQATYQRLLANRFPATVICNNIGLSSTAGALDLYIFEDGSGMNSLYRRAGLQDGWGVAQQSIPETIHVETLDRYCTAHTIQSIDFLKVDVEGHELDVFRGAQDMLAQRRIKVIQFEYGGCNIDSHTLLKDIFEFFSAYSYRFFKLYPHELRAVPRYDQRLENFAYQNWAIIESDALNRSR